ncbi:MAG TPA: hypothetical protein VFB25_05205 [Gaiellaceae bacterium]|nr:hypothetical protein [Gaiellaceae bacterium]
MRRLAATIAVLSFLALAGGAAITAARGGPPGFPQIPGNWAHAEINVRIGKKPHTLILDRGRIMQVSPTQITLRELGTPTPVPLDASTVIMFRARQITAAQLRRGLYAETMIIDGGAAVRVRETLAP